MYSWRKPLQAVRADLPQYNVAQKTTNCLSLVHFITKFLAVVTFDGKPLTG